MRVAFLATGYADYSVEAATALARHADVLLAIDREHLARDAGAQSVREFRQLGRLTTFTQRHPFRIAGCLKTWSTIARFRPDVVVAHEHFHAHIAWLHRVLARSTRLVLIVHDPVAHTGRDREWASLKSRYIRAERQLASCFLVHGEFCRDQLREVEDLRGRPAVAIPHGPILRPPGAAAPLHRRRALMFGRMEPYKGLEVLLDAARSLAAQGAGIEIRIAGTGPELARLEAPLREAGCSIRSEFIPRDDAIAELQAAGLVLAPYTEATQSGVVAAAFANGRPVVASSVGGLPELVRHGHNGLLVAPGDPGALANAIRSSIDSPGELERLAAGASASASAELGWDKFAAAVLSLA